MRLEGLPPVPRAAPASGRGNPSRHTSAPSPPVSSSLAAASGRRRAKPGRRGRRRGRLFPSSRTPWPVRDGWPLEAPGYGGARRRGPGRSWWRRLGVPPQASWWRGGCHGWARLGADRRRPGGQIWFEAARAAGGAGCGLAPPPWTQLVVLVPQQWRDGGRAGRLRLLRQQTAASSADVLGLPLVVPA